jgi:hypothetical protein
MIEVTLLEMLASIVSVAVVAYIMVATKWVLEKL